MFCRLKNEIYSYLLDNNIHICIKYVNNQYKISRFDIICLMEDENEVEKIETSDPFCPRCGLRSFADECANCGAKIVDKSDDEDEEYDWREYKR